MQLLQCQTKGTGNWMKCLISCQHNLDGCGEPYCKATRIDDDIFSLNYTRNCSQVPTCSTMPERFMPTLVYQRRRRQKNDITNFPVHPSNGAKSSNGCLSIVGSQAHSLAAEDPVLSVSNQATNALRSPIVDPVKCSGVSMPSSAGCYAGKENGPEYVLTNKEDRILNAHDVTDKSLSLKWNLGPSDSLKTEMVKGGVNFISAVSIDNNQPEEISQRDLCVSILRRQGLLDNLLNRQNRVSTENTVLSSACYCLKACGICEHMESTSNMLVCDDCEDSFHVSCYNPKMTMLPRGEWLCSSCSKKKHKLLKDKSTGKSVNIGAEIGRNQYSTSEGELGSLEFMFTDTEPYISNVRIGDEFQAEVPDWNGPVNEPSDLVGDPLEMNSPKNVSMEEPIKPLKLNSIGNWIQCQRVIEGINSDINGTICGKWRRAPLFESQNDEWECFRCILWDPARADCAVPQELETAEITRQLKYMELLKPRLPGLTGKRRRFDCWKGTAG